MREGKYEGLDGTRRPALAVPGPTADNGDCPCFGQRLLQPFAHNPHKGSGVSRSSNTGPPPVVVPR